jgi:hypothetical protein
MSLSVVPRPKVTPMIRSHMGGTLERKERWRRWFLGRDVVDSRFGMLTLCHPIHSGNLRSEKRSFPPVHKAFEIRVFQICRATISSRGRW